LSLERTVVWSRRKRDRQRRKGKIKAKEGKENAMERLNRKKIEGDEGNGENEKRLGGKEEE
jgi:hypothetical protein